MDSRRKKEEVKFYLYICTFIVRPILNLRYQRKAGDNLKHDINGEYQRFNIINKTMADMNCRSLSSVG